jgi:hypothetical protein
MSLPQFDPEVRLENVMVAGARLVGDEFTATGPLREEQQSRTLRVLVSIWQTEADTLSGGSATAVLARALGEGQQDPDKPGKWIARLAMQDQTTFKEGPATGVGLIVDNDGDPTGFGTYTWTERLQIKKP